MIVLLRVLLFWRKDRSLGMVAGYVREKELVVIRLCLMGLLSLEMDNAGQIKLIWYFPFLSCTETEISTENTRKAVCVAQC